MRTEKKKDRGAKTGCTDFESACKGFHGMLEGISKCCAGQKSPFDCSTMIDRMMKNMMEKCCLPKADNTKT